MNNYEFWKEYNENIRARIKRLLSKKEKIYTDLHIHSTCSADGTQTLEKLIKNCKEMNLDIISITDHDNTRIYDELYYFLQNRTNNDWPIIIPGIEFTVECREYGSQCHNLQYYINPKDPDFMKCVSKNLIASWKRIKKQFERINENKVLQDLANKKGLILSIEEYNTFLINERLYYPEYITLMEYIKNKLKLIDVDVITLWKKLEDENEKDVCEERKQIKRERYRILKEKHPNFEEEKNSTRLLLSILAVKGLDDDFFEGYESSGSLSVNYYWQLKINELCNKYIKIFAHPNYEKFDVLRNIQNISPDIAGMELNYRSYYSEKEQKEFYEIAQTNNMIVTLGSDSHTDSNKFYNNMDFYLADKKDLEILNEWRNKC